MSILFDLPFNRLSPEDSLKPFSCKNKDLTDFFHDDSALYGRQLLATTYTFENEDEVVAYFSVLNDRISCEQAETGKFPRRVYKKIPNGKRRDAYPAVKIGRLAVNIKYERKGIGSDILDVIKHFFISNNKTGCRFITVDASNEDYVINFYRKNGFIFLTDEDKEDDTRLMFFDLINFQPAG